MTNINKLVWLVLEQVPTQTIEPYSQDSRNTSIEVQQDYTKRQEQKKTTNYQGISTTFPNGISETSKPIQDNIDKENKNLEKIRQEKDKAFKQATEDELKQKQKEINNQKNKFKGIDPFGTKTADEFTKKPNEIIFKNQTSEELKKQLQDMLQKNKSTQ